MPCQETNYGDLASIPFQSQFYHRIAILCQLHVSYSYATTPRPQQTAIHAPSDSPNLLVNAPKSGSGNTTPGNKSEVIPLNLGKTGKFAQLL